jgi:hypothetical protein
VIRAFRQYGYSIDKKNHMKKTSRKKFVSQHEVALPQAELKAGPATNPVCHDLGGGSAAFCAEAEDIVDKAPCPGSLSEEDQKKRWRLMRLIRCNIDLHGRRLSQDTLCRG